jgi:hypothetical protein
MHSWNSWCISRIPGDLPGFLVHTPRIPDAYSYENPPGILGILEVLRAPPGFLGFLQE